jgi:hypothetical protein
MILSSNGGREGTDRANVHTNQNRRIPPPFRPPSTRTYAHPPEPTRFAARLGLSSPRTCHGINHNRHREMRALPASAMCRPTHTHTCHMRALPGRVRRRRPGALAKPRRDADRMRQVGGTRASRDHVPPFWPFQFLSKKGHPLRRARIWACRPPLNHPRIDSGCAVLLGVLL